MPLYAVILRMQTHASTNYIAVSRLMYVIILILSGGICSRVGITPAGGSIYAIALLAGKKTTEICEIKGGKYNAE